MEISDNKMVVLTYELREQDENGSIIQTVDKEKPFSFLCGGGYMLPAFEQNLQGKSAGESYAFALTSEEGYGSQVEDMIVDIPISVFMVDEKPDEDMLQVGQYVPMQNEQGQPMQGKVLGVTDESVSMDFNHPLAGANLYFSGEVLEVREPTEAELAEARQMCAHPDDDCADDCMCG